MKRIILPLAVGYALLGITACATANSQSSALQWSGTAKRIFLEHEIYLSEMSANGNGEQRPDWTEAARDHIVKSVAEYLGERGIELVVAPDVIPRPSYAEILSDYGAEYRLYFVQSRGYPTSGLTARNAVRVAGNAIQVVGAIAGALGGPGGPGKLTFAPIEGSITFGGDAELFDARTGVLVWRRHFGSVDLREEQSTRRMVINILHDVK
jgi:hypothetical protein